MDECVYYWEKSDVYCYRSEVDNFREKYGDDYEMFPSGEFFSTIWKDKE